MKVILQETMDGVGHLGDLLNVADGFARNYLLPRGKAVEANSRSIKAFEHAKRVSAVTLTIEMQAGKDDKLFGSVTAKDIAEGLAAQGFPVDRRKIQLAHPVKELGTVTVPIKMPRDVMATVTVNVVKKQESEETPA
jgi:large subunit ribosomal protein L9